VLLASAAGAGAALVAGCGGDSRPLRPISAGARELDIRLLNDALAIEQQAIALYTAGGPLLTGQAREAVSQLLGQELQHAGELRKLLKHLRGTAHNPDAHYDLGRPRSRQQLLALMHEAERRQVAAYLQAIPRISSPGLRQALASILANDAQHLVVLRLEQGMRELPGPFLTDDE
jgi:rubrerythrin